MARRLHGIPLTILLFAALATAVLVGLVSPHAAAAGQGRWKLPKPSANQGRKGTYRCTTSRKGYNYYVCAPGKYTPASPAGIHVFFHGLGGQSMARNFDLWKPFLADGRCIGINMEYTDGNPHKDKAGKAAAAMEAVRQVMADYPVAIGRGAMTAFSAGGSPAGAWFKAKGAGATSPNPDWPFSHVNVFGAALNVGQELTRRPTSWFRAMGEGEEKMAPGLLDYMVKKTAANLADGGCPDVILLVTKGRGHTLPRDEIAMAAACFRRAAIIHAPFLYRPPNVDPKVGAAIDAANARRFAEALESEAASAGLKKLIRGQMAKQVAMLRKLAAENPTLAAVYGGVCRRQFKGTDAVKRLDEILPNDKALAICKKWHAKFGELFTGRGIRLAEGAGRWLRAIAKAAGAKSTIAEMAERYLAFD